MSARNADILFDAIHDRRAFPLAAIDPAPIDLSLVERMLEAANWAPNHRRTEPWRFVVFSGEGRRRLAEALVQASRQLHPEEDPPEERHLAAGEKVWLAPVWIALGMHLDPRLPEWEETVAFGCAVHNAWLMAHALGLGCKWTSGATAVHPAVASAAGLPEDVALRGFLYAGRPAGTVPSGSRRPHTDKVTWIDG